MIIVDLGYNFKYSKVHLIYLFGYKERTLGRNLKFCLNTKRYLNLRF
jgi:hypothetical protein